MTLALYKRVVLTRDLPEEGLRAGQGGVIVEHYPARIDVSESYELKIFGATGQTIWRGLSHHLPPVFGLSLNCPSSRYD